MISSFLERWLPVVGWELYYLVSSWGRVRSLPRTDRLGRSHPGKIMNTPVGAHGYPEVRLSVNGVGKTRTVHSLVAEAFLGPRPEGQQVRHLDGVRTHNMLSNLAYGTPSEDAFDKVRHGTHHYSKRDRCSNDHIYTPETTKIIYHADGSFARRQCLICERQWKSDWAERQKNSGLACTTDGCDRPQVARGLCQRCYQRKYHSKGGEKGYELKICAFCDEPFRKSSEHGQGFRKYCSDKCARGAATERQRQNRRKAQ